MARFVVVLALLMFGTVAQAQAQDETPPDITSATVTPTSLPKEGGTVTVKATVTDDVGVQQVYVEANGSDGGFFSAALAHTSGANYQGTLTLPSNPTEEERSYTINVFASDAAQNYSEPRFAGEVSVAAQPQMDPFPWVSDPTVEPRALPSGGGDVTIGAIATDNRSVSEVYAAVTAPGGFYEAVPMEGTSDVHFEGVFTAPANTGAAPRVYSVTIYALDDIGQEDSVDAGKITVAGVSGTPGQLNAHVLDGAFGKVTIGQIQYRRIKVRNLGQPGSPPVPVTAALVGDADFSLVGPTTFRVRPGESRYLLVRFAPTSVGQKKADVFLYRTDGVAQNFQLRLTGRGRAA